MNNKKRKEIIPFLVIAIILIIIIVVEIIIINTNKVETENVQENSVVNAIDNTNIEGEYTGYQLVLTVSYGGYRNIRTRFRTWRISKKIQYKPK